MPIAWVSTHRHNSLVLWTVDIKLAIPLFFCFFVFFNGNGETDGRVISNDWWRWALQLRQELQSTGDILDPSHTSIDLHYATRWRRPKLYLFWKLYA